MSSTEQSSLIKNAAIWGLALWLMQMSLVTPFALLTVWFAAVPVVMLYLKTNRAWFAGIAAASLVAGSVVYGAFAVLFLVMALLTLIPGIALAEAYRRGKSARKSITAGVIAYLAVYLLSILAATMMGVNITNEIGTQVRESVNVFVPESVRSMISDEALQEFIQRNVMMIPFYFIASATLLASITHTVSRRIANRLAGGKIPSLPPAREWRLPRSFIWYYLIALFAELFVPVDPQSFVSTIVVNAVPIFMLAFVTQGVAFLFFLGYVKRKMWIPWVGFAAVIFINPLFMPFSLLGVFDTAFPIRERFRKS